MKVMRSDVKRMFFVRLNSGDDVLDGLKKAVEKEKIQNAFIVSGLGSVKSYHYHVVADTNMPPKESFPKGSLPLDVLNINGLIIDGRVHAHITFADDDHAQGGHLEPGTKVLTFCAIGLMECESVDYSKWDAIGVDF